MEDLNLDALVRQTGGNAYQLVALFQKRMRELERGWPPLVEAGGRRLHQIVQEEFERGLVRLATGEEADSLREERDLEEAEILRRRVGRDADARSEERQRDAPPSPSSP